MNLGRIYELTVVNPVGDVKTITQPITVEFSVIRNTLATTNSIELTVTNLGDGSRNWLFKDRYDTTTYWQMEFKAGYQGKNMYTIFLGNIMEAFSVKDGTEWKTKISGYDGLFGIQNGFMSGSLAAGTPVKDLASAMTSSLPNVKRGLLGAPTLGQTGRAVSFFGATRDLLEEYFPGKYFIDNEKLNIVSDNEIDDSTVINLNSDQLLATPERRDTFLVTKSMFIPQVRLFIIVNLASNYPIYNGQYQVIGLEHSGIISESVNGELTTTLMLNAGAGAFKPIS